MEATMEPAAVSVPEPEPSTWDEFHKAFHVVLNQLVDDAPDQNAVMDYPGVMSVIMAMFKVAPEGGIARDVISEHLDDVMFNVFGLDDIADVDHK
jgi:hypothetical protein